MDQLSYNWWTVALRGMLAVGIGLIALFFPSITLIILILLFGAFALVDGVLLLIAGIRSRKENERWWALILLGILSMAVALIAFFVPLVTALALLFLMAAWAIIGGMLEIIAAIQLRKQIKGEWILVLDGVITLLFGLALIIMPAAAILALVWLFGGFKVISGVLLLILSFRLKRNKNYTVHSGEYFSEKSRSSFKTS